MSVDSARSTQTQAIAGHQLCTSELGGWFSDGRSVFASAGTLFGAIVGSFARDHDVVHVALAQAGAANADELRLFLQFPDRSAADVAHTALHAADKLVDDHADRPAIRNAALDAFRHQLRQAIAIAVVVREHRHG